MDAFLEDFKADLLRSKYLCNNEPIGLDTKLTDKDRRVWQLVERAQYGLHAIEDGKVYKVVRVKMDLGCVCVVESTFGEVLERIFNDFERSFFSRTEGEHETLPKRVFVARNGIEISLYLESDAELNVA